MADFKSPNSNTTAGKQHDESSSAMDIDGSEEDRILSKSQYLTREEVIKRRLRNCKQLDRCYRDHYWALMEDLKAQYRKYVWIHGRSPYREDEERDDGSAAAADGGTAENHHHHHHHNNSSNSNGGLRERAKCAMSGCKAPAMELTIYCHQHIMCDIKQTMYKSCTFVVKSASSGPIFCGKPALKTAVPSNCPGHLQKAEEHLAKALKKQGHKASDTPRAPPKLHVLVAEYVRQIQTKRIAAKKKRITKKVQEANTNVQVARTGRVALVRESGVDSTYLRGYSLPL